MEIFRGLALVADVEAIAVDVGDCPFQVELEPLRGPLLATVPRGGAPAMPAGPDRPLPPASCSAVAQNRLEPMLQGQLAASGVCQVRRGVELTMLSQDCSGVTARLRERSSRAQRLVRAACLVGADGAHSTVRAEVGIEMRGHDHMSRELNILFDADLWSALGDVRAILYQVRHPQLPAPCLFRSVDGRRRWSLLTPWFEDASPQRCRQLIQPRSRQTSWPQSNPEPAPASLIDALVLPSLFPTASAVGRTEQQEPDLASTDRDCQRPFGDQRSHGCGPCRRHGPILSSECPAQ